MLLDVLIAVAASAVVQTLAVAAATALRPRANIYVTIVAVALITAPLAFIGDRLLFGRTLDLDGRLFLVLQHLTVGGLLFHFMTLPDRSVTLRILVELSREPGGALSIAGLTDRYGVRVMIASRLRQLADGGFLTIAADGAIELQPRGVRFGRFVVGGRRWFRIASAN